MSVWLSERELARLVPAERLAGTPMPTRMVSNGEYLPLPQTAAQRAVEGELARLAETNGARLGLDRRGFLRSACGMAAALLASNAVFGRWFEVDAAEAAEPDAATARAAALSRQFVFDVQLHFIRDDYADPGILSLGEYAKRWNPVLEREGVALARYKFTNFLKEVFLDSDTRLGLVSGAPSDTPATSLVSSEQLARARRIVNELAGSRRLFAHAMFAPGRPGWLDEIDRAIETLRPDSWKGYTVGDPLAVSKYPWRLDDEKLVYPAYEKMQKSGIRTVCIHKGLIPADYETSFEHWRYAMVDDVARAAKDWPGLTFVIYHSGLKPFMAPPDALVKQFDTSGRIDWVTDLAEIPAKHGVSNVYAEIGTSFASTAVTHPKLCAAMLGTLVRGFSAERVLWGTDSVWYGSPQWQLEAFRRLEIPAEMLSQHGFAALGPADGATRRAILGENAARLYGIEPNVAALDADRLSAAKRDYLASGRDPSHAAYGYVDATGA